MKWAKIILTAMLASALGACAGNQTQTAAEDTEYGSVEKYQRAVQAGAERKNINVYWVNPPDEDDLDEHEKKDKDG